MGIIRLRWFKHSVSILLIVSVFNACSMSDPVLMDYDPMESDLAEGGRLQSSLTFAGSTVEQVHWTILDQTSVGISWKGSSSENSLQIGTSPGSYSRSLQGLTPSPLPTSSSGPFYEARVENLQPNTQYYFKIGNSGEMAFRTPVARGQAGFWFAEQADVGSSATYSRVTALQNQIAEDHPSLSGDDRPRFVLVPGDLTYADQSGDASDVDQHFNDVMPWSTFAAYMPIWGNHEWGSSVDGLHNYKGRFILPNAYASPGSPDSHGEDWYWFDYGNIRFVAYPEPHSGAWADWRIKAESIMRQAQNDSAIAFIITFGHRPAYSTGSHPSVGSSTAAKIAAYTDELRALFPKYRLNLNGHSHNYERTCPIANSGSSASCASASQGVTHVTGGAGGADVGSLNSAQFFTVFRAMHLHHMRFNALNDRLNAYVICGPDLSDDDNSCSPGQIIDQFTIYASSVSVPEEPPTQTPTPTPTPTPAPTPAPTPTEPPASGALQISAAADTTIKEGSSISYGSQSRVEVDNSPVEQALIKFNVSGIGSSSVASAKLVLTASNASDVGGRFYAVSNSWSESTTTYANAPALGSLVASLGAVAVGGVYQVDVTSLIRADGTYSLRILSTSSDGADFYSREDSSGRGPKLIITLGSGSSNPTPTPTPTPPPAPVAGSFSKRIASSSDDAEEQSSGSVSLSSTDLEFVRDGSDQVVGLRFTGVSVPANARITNAYIQFTTDEVTSVTTNLMIYGQKSLNPATFSTAAYDISSRPQTSAAVGWSAIPAWSIVGEQSSAQRTPNLAPIVSELVTMSGYQSGGSMVFIFKGSGERVAKCYDGSSSAAPLLVIEYEQ